VGLMWYADPARERAGHRRSRVVLVVLAAMFLIGTTEAAAQRRATRARTLIMTATAYCLGRETSTGTQARSGTVAADPRVLPMGTTIRVTGLTARRPQTFTVADTGAAVKGHVIDIFIRDCARAKTFGRRPVQVRVLKLP
jgi:3D (Asp-Asp-Asp) domain-containing protein